jgi:uncharacterized protein
MTMDLLLLGLVVAFGTAVQTSIGFGSMVVAVTLGASLLPVSELVPLLVPVTFAQTVVIAGRDRDHIAWPLLLKRVLPLMGAGMLAAILAAPADATWMRPVLGVMILGLALRELLRVARPAGNPVAANVGIVVAGVVHGIFATGGPPLVWALGQEHLDKRTFRATLTFVWLSLNAVLIATFMAGGRIDLGTLTTSAGLMVPGLIGIGAGQWLHTRVDEGRFRTGVWVLLAIASLPLILR